MTLEAAMRGYLLPLVPEVEERVYPFGLRPQDGALPAITYSLVAGPTSHYSHGGVSDHEVSFQFDCWAVDPDGAIDLDGSLRSALDGYRGEWEGFRIGSVFLSLVLDEYEPDLGLFRRMRQAAIHYRDPEGS